MLTAASIVIGLHIGTYHFDRTRDYEEFNPGISVTVENWTAGIYRNSEARASVYGAWVWRPHRHLDVAFGGVTGYSRAKLVPLVVPSTKVGNARFSLLLPVEKGGGASTSAGNSEMGAALDLSGRRFGRLFVNGRAERPAHMVRKATWWLTRCDCGREHAVVSASLVSGKTRSCGCGADNVAILNTTHGMTGTPTFYSWCAMRARCQNPREPKYPRYGGRGIKVCERWGAFESFLADMGERPIGHTLDRRDNDGDYEPGNCRWATPKQQSRNQSTTVFVVFRGERRALAELADELGLSVTTVHSRLRRGWDLERALQTPVTPRQRG